MKRLVLVLLLTVVMGMVPSLLLAQQSSSQPYDANIQHQSANQGNMGTDTGKAKSTKQDWREQHRKFQEEVNSMNQRLDQKIAAMNSAQGDQKISAMSDVLNELVTQRHEFQRMFSSMHGKRMAHRMERHKGSANLGYPGYSGCGEGSMSNPG